MIAGRDSSADRPSIDQLRQALAAGVQNWGGYLATKGGVNLYSPWDYASFDRVKQVLPSMPLAYASGWDDPWACAQMAQQWGVRLCLDVEDGIRGDGAWVQDWLDASGAGLYANRDTCMRWRAPFKIMAHYLSADPGVTWEGPPPQEPHGWQWGGDLIDWGLGVDRLWLDDWFAGGAQAQLVREENMSIAADRGDGTTDYLTVLPDGRLWQTHNMEGGAWEGQMLQGKWAAIIESTWVGGGWWITGVGWDGGVFQLSFSWDGGWNMHQYS